MKRYWQVTAVNIGCPYPHPRFRLLNCIFTTLLYEDATNQWALARPLLPLILIHSACYKEFPLSPTATPDPAPSRGLPHLWPSCQPTA